MKAVEEIQRQGYTILKGIIPDDQVINIKDDIIKAADMFGVKNPNNTYLATTINHTQSFAYYTVDWRIMEVMESFFGPHVRISSTTTQINESRNKRGHWHADWPHTAGYIAKPIPDVVLHLTTIFMLADFTRENGGTLIRPSSHKWGSNPTYDNEHIFDDYEDQIYAEGLAGSVLVMDSRLWHAIAINNTNSRRVALVVRYAPWWLNLDVLMAGTVDQKIIVEEQPGTFNISYPPLSQEAYEQINDIAKPLFRHWVQV